MADACPNGWQPGCERGLMWPVRAALRWGELPDPNPASRPGWEPIAAFVTPTARRLQRAGRRAMMAGRVS